MHRSSFLLGTFLTLLTAPSNVVCTEQTSGTTDPSTRRCSSILLDDTWNDIQIQSFKGCTIVEGNVEVTTRTNTLTDSALSVLTNITEITGYLVLGNLGNMTTLPMPQLRLIRGQQIIQNITETRNYSLMIGNAYELVDWPFTRLQEISNGDVLLFNIPKLCNVDTIDWEDLQNRRVNGVVTYNVGTSTNGLCRSCNESCDGYCWAPDVCQTRSLRICSSVCKSRCVERGVFGCCDSQCSGGCYAAMDKSQCVACKAYQSGNVCVNQCQPLEIYNHTTFQYIPNPDAQYIHGSQCVSQCPNSMFTDGQFCVDSCPVGKYTVENNSVCVDCDGICPKDCVGGEFTTGTRKNFMNCTQIMKHLKVDGRKHLTLADLETLSSVRYIHHYLDIIFLPSSVTSLSFLRNLEEIGGTMTTLSNSLAVESNAHLKELGLRSLWKVAAGDVYVVGNPQLCMTVTKENLVAAGVISPNQRVFSDNCGSPTPPCHSQCNALLGCWGPSNAQQCLGCQNFDYDGICVSNCSMGGTDRLLFSNFEKKECQPCHEECAIGCSGVNPDNCTACKNVQDGPFCRHQCPPGKYANSTSHCQWCNSACSSECSGSGTHKGPGGCDNCDLFILNDNETSVIECVDQQAGCPAHKYEHVISEPVNHPFILRHVCRECDPQCTSCFGAGPAKCSLRNCVSVIDNGVCLPSCPPNKYQSVNSTCKKCPEKCGELGCLLTTNTSHIKCKECPYLIDINGSNICVSICPTDHPVVNASNQMCLDQCHQFIVHKNGTRFCQSECPNNTFINRNSNECHPECPNNTFINRNSNECQSECPNNSFIEPDVDDELIYCSNCHTECRRVAGKKTCLNASNHVTACLNGCRNYHQGNHCVPACDENTVPVTEGPGQASNSSSEYFVMECVEMTVKRTTPNVVTTLETMTASSTVTPNPMKVDANQSEDGDSDLTVIIAAAAGGGGLLLLLIVIICCVCRQRHQKKKFVVDVVFSNDIAMIRTVENGMTSGRKLLVIEEKRLELGNLLSSGDFGSVYKGTLQQQLYNEKLTVSVRVLNEGTLKVSGKKQLDSLASFGHPQIVSLIGVCTTSHVMLVHEFLPLGTLVSFLRSRKRVLFGQDLLSFSRQITEGMSFLEGMKIAHRNLSAKSIFVDTPATVKIGDVALPAVVNIGTPYYKTEGPMAPSKWLAPECLQQLQFSHKSDVWAFGVTMWEIMTLGNQPYKGVDRSRLLSLLKDGRRLPKPLASSRGIYALMLQCWSFLPDNRPAFQQLTEDLSFALQNTTEHVNTSADIEKRNAAATNTMNVYTEVDADKLGENDDDGYDMKAGPTFSPGDSDDWYTATGMYISPLNYAARNEFGIPVVGLSPNPMYGGLGRKDRPTMRSSENLLYVSAEDTKSSKSSLAENIIYNETNDTVVYESIIDEKN